LWAALRYVELNPVRAGMVTSAEEWKWSSADVHCGLASPGPMLEMEHWQKRWTAGEWRQFLAQAESVAEISALRHCTHTGRPLGSEEFITELEQTMLRPLMPRKGGRPKKSMADSRQLSFTSVA
jgi:putative transposase